MFKKYTKNLDVKKLICERSWTCISEDSSSISLFFKRDGSFYLTTDGQGISGKWDYLHGNGSIVLNHNNNIHMYKSVFSDENMVVLNLDKTDSYAILIDEGKILNSQKGVENYLQNKEESKRNEEISIELELRHKEFERQEREWEKQMEKERRKKVFSKYKKLISSLFPRFFGILGCVVFLYILLVFLGSSGCITSRDYLCKSLYIVHIVNCILIFKYFKLKSYSLVKLVVTALPAIWCLFADINFHNDNGTLSSTFETTLLLLPSWICIINVEDDPDDFFNFAHIIFLAPVLNFLLAGMISMPFEWFTNVSNVNRILYSLLYYLNVLYLFLAIIIQSALLTYKNEKRPDLVIAFGKGESIKWRVFYNIIYVTSVGSITYMVIFGL